MLPIPELVEQLTGKNTVEGCRAMQQLVEMSKTCTALYPYLDAFIAMLESGNSYVRTRGLMLLAYNARWDTEHRIDAALDAILAHIADEKPITARQCIQVLPVLAAAKPALCGRIQAALHTADVSGYADSMRPLVLRDIGAALAAIDALPRA